MSRDMMIWMAVVIIMLVCMVIAGSLLMIAGSPQFKPDMACVNMNGGQIIPDAELCKASCNAHTEFSHMQAHYDEICRCCNARGVDYSSAGEYQPKIYVINPDGSQGVDLTCAYYPDAAGCKS